MTLKLGEVLTAGASFIETSCESRTAGGSSY
jgi:hypothetical protein